MQNRRKFVKNILIGAAGISTLSSFDILDIVNKEKLVKLTILHTNDMHSRIDPFGPNDKKYANQGGMSRIANLVEQIRNKESNVILLDAGDIFQGTPYFNLFGGEIELKLMSQMKYDASTMGNHDFDNGIEGFNKVLHNANFPFLCANYDFNDTILKGKTKPYHIIEKQGIKIGIFGIGIELDGLVDSRLCGNTKYNDPITAANKYAKLLKEEHACNMVICLSHLGHEYESEILSDKTLAKSTENIDLIIGGHTHTFLEKAVTFSNKIGQPILINQAGWAALSLGRVDFYFNRKKERVDDLSASFRPSKNYANI
jgi:5'-nucleotidase